MAVPLSELRDRLEDLAHRPDLVDTSVEKFFLNSAMRMLQRAGYYRGQDATSVLSSSAITSGTSGLLSIALPSDFRHYEDVAQSTPSFKTGFSVISRQRANVVYKSRVTLADNLESVVLTKSNIVFYPGYTAGGNFSAGHFTFALYYKQWLADMIEETDSNYFTNNASDIMVFAAYALVLAWTHEFDEAQRFLTLANNLGRQFVLSEYGETVAGKHIKLGDLEQILVAAGNQSAQEA